MFHDPLMAEIRRIRAEILAEHGNDLHRLCQTLRREDAQWVEQGHALIPMPRYPGLEQRLAKTARGRKASA